MLLDNLAEHAASFLECGYALKRKTRTSLSGWHDEHQCVTSESSPSHPFPHSLLHETSTGTSVVGTLRLTNAFELISQLTKFQPWNRTLASFSMRAKLDR
jgi:hypothetical protein